MASRRRRTGKGKCDTVMRRLAIDEGEYITKRVLCVFSRSRQDVVSDMLSEIGDETNGG